MKTKIVVAVLAVVVLAVGALAVACAPDDKTEETGSDTVVSETVDNTTETIVIEVEEETVE